MSSATFWPRLTPDSTRSGRLSAMILRTPMMTQSVGVPLTAKWRGLISRSRNGSLSDSECATPDWSLSGATTHMSSESSPAIASRIFRPWALMPSSLVSKIRMGPAFRPFSTPGALTVLGRIGDSRDSGIAGAAFASKGAELRPAVRGPAQRGKLELRSAAVLPVVIMVGEHLAFRGFHGLLPAGADEAAGRGEYERAAALSHVPAVPVA